MGWRLIDTDLNDPYFVTAADDALLQAYNPADEINTVHLYRRNTPTISIGRSRHLQQDINHDVAQQYNVAIIRRTTGGGTIFTDPGCLIYSIIFQPEKQSSQAIFNKVCTCLKTMLQTFDITPEFKPPNDLLLNGKKISGSAQRHQKNSILIHGTILVSPNLELMQQVLNIPENKSITTLEQEMENPPSINQVKKQLIKEFEQEFHTILESGTFTSKEHNIINQLMEKRYKQEQWTFAR